MTFVIVPLIIGSFPRKTSERQPISLGVANHVFRIREGAGGEPLLHQSFNIRRNGQLHAGFSFFFHTSRYQNQRFPREHHEQCSAVYSSGMDSGDPVAPPATPAAIPAPQPSAAKAAVSWLRDLALSVVIMIIV